MRRNNKNKAPSRINQMRTNAMNATPWLSIIFLLLAVALFASPAFAANPGHNAPAIGPGTFEAGQYTIPGNLTITQILAIGINATINGSPVCTAGNGQCGAGIGSAGGWTNTSTATTTGLNVGIGTASPTQRLDVNGSVNISDQAWINGSRVCTAANGFCGSGNGNLAGIGTAGYLPLWQNSTFLNDSAISFDSGTQVLTYWYDIGGGSFAPALMMDLANQRVSIGITDQSVLPEAPLVVSALASDSGVLKVHSQNFVAGDNWWIGFSNNNALNASDAYDAARIGVNLGSGGSGRLFFTTGLPGLQAQRMIIDESGKVNITSGPLFVNNSQVCTATNGQCATGSGGSLSGGTAGYIAQWQNSTALNNSLIFQNSTKVGIGTTAPSQEFAVIGNANITGTTFTNNVTLAGNSIQDSGNAQRIRFENGNIIMIIG